MAQVNTAAITYKSSGKIPAAVVFQPQKMQCYAVCRGLNFTAIENAVYMPVS